MTLRAFRAREPEQKTGLETSAGRNRGWNHISVPSPIPADRDPLTWEGEAPRWCRRGHLQGPPNTTTLLSCSAEEVHSFFQRNGEQYLALIFEKSDSFVGREVGAAGVVPGSLSSRHACGQGGMGMLSTSKK